MPPRWFRDESNKRSSMLSFVTPQQDTTTTDQPFFDQHSLRQTEDRARRISAMPASGPALRKRYSLFGGRGASATDSTDSHRWPRIFGDPSSVTEMTPPVEYTAPPSSKLNRRSMTIRHPRNDPIVKWMKRVERTSFAISEEEESRGIKKASISEPFNFQHVTHHGARELPELNFTSQSDLTRSFWAACAQQTPNSDLKGIRAEHLSAGPLRSRPTSIVSSHPSVSEGAQPHPPLRTARSFSGASIEAPRRPSLLSRSASFASLVAEQREPPSMVHPAFRSSEDSLSFDTVIPWTLPVGLQTPASEANRNLDVVLEEAESPSPVKRPGRLMPLITSDQSPTNASTLTGSPNRVSLSRSDDRDNSTLDQYDTSAPSLSSGETWEEDVDFCYNMEAESTCDFQWRGRKAHLDSPHDSVMASPRIPSDELRRPWNVSPRTSMASHQRNKSSMTMTPMLASPLSVSNEWSTPSGTDADDSTTEDIDGVTDLLDLAAHVDPEWSSDDEASSLRSAQVSTPPATRFMNRLSASSSVRDIDHPSEQARSAGSSSPVSKSTNRSSIISVKDSRRSSRSKLVVNTSSDPASHPAPSPPPTTPLPALPSQTQSSLLTKRHTMHTVATRATMDRIRARHSSAVIDPITVAPRSIGHNSPIASSENPVRPRIIKQTMSEYSPGPESDWF